MDLLRRNLYSFKHTAGFRLTCLKMGKEANSSFFLLFSFSNFIQHLTVKDGRQCVYAPKEIS